MCEKKCIFAEQLVCAKCMYLADYYNCTENK